jgi:hypothetical protein
MDGTLIVGIVNSVAIVIAAWLTRRGQGAIRSDVADVHHEVKTGNGETLGQLADLAEGRRVETQTDRPA